MIKKFFWVSLFVGGFFLGSIVFVSAEETTTETTEIVATKTCEEFCKFKTGSAAVSQKSCLEACTGCMGTKIESYPDLDNFVCSGSYGAWVDPVNTTRDTWLTSYKGCDAEAGNRVFANNTVSSAAVPVSDMYHLKRDNSGRWNVKSMNPNCYKSGDKLLDYSVRSGEMLWWERIDGPLEFFSNTQVKTHTPLVANCVNPMTSTWLSKINDFGDFAPLCGKPVEGVDHTKDKNIVSICPAPTDNDVRNYRPNEQIACSKKLFEIKLNCECQQMGLNAWLEMYENQGSYLQNLQSYYQYLGETLYYVKEDDKDPVKLQIFGKEAPTENIKKKTEKVDLSQYIKLADYKINGRSLTTEFLGKVHWQGQYTTDANNVETATTETVSIGTLINGVDSDKGLSWKAAKKGDGAEIFQQDYTRVDGLIRKIAKENNIEDEKDYKLFLAELKQKMNLLALKPQGSLKSHAVKIDHQLKRWEDVVEEIEPPTGGTSASTKPETPLNNPNFLEIPDTDVGNNDFIDDVPPFADFQKEFVKIEARKTKLLRVEDNGGSNEEYKKFKVLQQRKTDIQRKIGLLDKRMGKFKQAQQVGSTTSYPVTRVLKTKYETKTRNGSGGWTVSPGSTESDMVLLKHERNEEYCRNAFIDLNKIKKEALPDGNDFQDKRNTIRRMEAEYKQACKNNFLDKVIYTVSQVLGTAAILLIIIGSYFLVTAQGDDSQISKGKNYLQYAAIGLVISFMSYTIVQFILDAILW